MIYRARERRSRRRVVLKAYVRQQRNPVRAQALDREQRMLRMAGPHAGVLGLERVLEVRRTQRRGAHGRGPRDIHRAGLLEAAALAHLRPIAARQHPSVLPRLPRAECVRLCSTPGVPPLTCLPRHPPLPPQNADATYLVLDAGTGGTLMELIANSGGRLPDHIAARKVALPLLRALAHLHARGIVHRWAAGGGRLGGAVPMGACRW